LERPSIYPLSLHDALPILAEVNPLARTADGQILCLDAKVTLDDNAAFRHPDHAALVDRSAVDPLEQRAKEKDLNYVKLDHGTVRSEEHTSELQSRENLVCR